MRGSVLLKYLTSSSSFAVVRTLLDLAVLNFISFLEIGLWQFLLSLIAYTGIIKLGLASSLNREYPVYTVSGKRKLAGLIYGQVHSFSILVSVIQGLVVGGFILFSDFDLSTVELYLTLLAIALFIFESNLMAVYEIILRSEDKFSSINYLQYVSSIVYILSFALVYFYGFTGFLIRWMVYTALRFGYVYYVLNRAKLIPSFVFRLGLLKKAIRAGREFWIWGYLKVVYTNLPKFLLGLLISVEFLGKLSPVFWISSAIFIFGSSLINFQFPSLAKALHDKEKWQKASADFLYSIGAFSGVFLLLALVGVGFVPMLVELFIPKYAAFSVVIQIVMVVSCFEYMLLTRVLFLVSKNFKKLYQLCFLNIAIRAAFLLIASYFVDNLIVFSILYSLPILLNGIVNFKMATYETKSSVNWRSWFYWLKNFKSIS